MKVRFTLLLALVVSLNLFGTQFWASNGVGKVGSIVSSSNNITTAYGSGAGSKIIASVSYKGNIAVVNGTATKIYVSYSSSTCASTNADDMVVPANGINTKDGAHIGGEICVRSSTGTISSGTVDAEVW